jgi:hypothetical protein
MTTAQQALVAIRDWMFDMHRMGREFSPEQREAAEFAAMDAAKAGAGFESAFEAGVVAINKI